jgi:hypothetical protein
MIEAGRGRVENQLISTYIHQFVKFPRGAEIMIHLPGYDVVNGSEYVRHLQRYLYHSNLHRYQTYSNEISQYYSYQYDPHPRLFDNIHSNESTEHSLTTFFRRQLEREFMDYILGECEEELKNKWAGSD